MNTLALLGLGVVIAPLIGSIIAGIFGQQIGKRGAQTVTILGVAISFILSLIIFKKIIFDGTPIFNGTIYTWAVSGNFTFNIGFLIDNLTAIMLVTVNFVSLLVHIYSIGYMADDSGNQRFFSYMSLFTFSMLTLVIANNFLQLYFGWEGVGLVSYLLIGFWFTKDSANAGSLKAFLVNRVGDFGFILGIAAILGYFGTLDYAQVFAAAPNLTGTTIEIIHGMPWHIITVICTLLFIGAMGKSAQMPLHVWLPESMEGPTPISALIHAATMVTAGIYLISRMSPLFELSPPALTMVLIIGATGALFTGLLAIVQTDIKRVIAYSTLSQLGYMVAALGASAFAAGIFHLVTHACFKALLFLAAGSVILAMHHEQNMRKMGGLWRYLPITYITFLMGSLALSAMPPFSGFFSKDAIIESIHASTIPGAGYGYICVLLGTFVTAFYTFRALFMTFHGKPRMSEKMRAHLHESPWVVTVPLIILAIPSVILGGILIEPILFAKQGLLGSGIMVHQQYDVLAEIAKHFQGPWSMALHAVTTLPFWLALSGIITAWICYVALPVIPRIVTQHFRLLYNILIHKYGFDAFNQIVFVDGTKKLANQFYQIGDVRIIDDGFVNGSARLINWISANARKMQTGYLYHYAFVMILGLLIFLWWVL